MCASPATTQHPFGPFEDVRQLPSTPAGRVIRDLLEVFNDGRTERIHQFISNRFTPEFQKAISIEEHLGVFANLRIQTGGFDFYGIRKYPKPRSDGSLVAIVQSKLTGLWNGIEVVVEDQSPYRIAGLRFMPARSPKDIPTGSTLLETELVRELESFLERVAKADVFSGAVLLAKDGSVLFKEAYSLASKRFNTPNKIDTKFNLGSMNKMFTAVSIAQLVEKGRLSFDDPLGKYLSSDWLQREYADKITLRHLLTHTSGLGSFFNDKFWKTSRMELRNLKDYKPLVSSESPAFEPGTAWAYSNTGFLLLGVVIEKVTGLTYDEYVEKHIHKPAGMTNTACYEMDRPVPNLAIGYSRRWTGTGEQWENNLYKHKIKGGSDGGGFSTVEDLLRFDVALRTNKLISADSVRTLFTPSSLFFANGNGGYGLGFSIQGEPENRIVGHGGGFAGISANLDMYLDSGYTVIVLSNYDHTAIIVSEKIKELLARVKQTSSYNIVR